MGIFNFLFGKNPQIDGLDLTVSSALDSNLTAITDVYYPQVEKIEEQWSVMYNLGTFSGGRSVAFEQMCLDNIILYKQMSTILYSYGEDPPPSAPAFKRLAMLYEKNGQYERAISVCVDALSYGAYGGNMKGRLARMIKKAGRDPSQVEYQLLE